MFQVDFMISVSPTQREVTLDDLDKFTNYILRVFAFTSLGNGVSSEPVSLQTQEDGKRSKCKVDFNTWLIL